MWEPESRTLALDCGVTAPGVVVPLPQTIETAYWPGASVRVGEGGHGAAEQDRGRGGGIGAETTGATSEIVAAPIPLAMLSAVPVTTTEMS